MPERNIKLILAYDGMNYHGWQRQKNGVTIQEVVEEKLARMLGEPVAVIASGRTDAGVHAMNQVCNFKTGTTLDAWIVRKGLNALLPKDIRVLGAEDVPFSFNARYSARKKRYRYCIFNGEVHDVFLRRTAWHIPQPLDAERMRGCLALIVGTRDFSSFRAAGSSNRNPVRTIFKADLLIEANRLWTIELEADGFLRHMVRNIVGTLVSAGRGKLTSGEFEGVLEARDRRAAGATAPAHGLFLVDVTY
ncbi:tRNA pseudouridine(38-40) synthase TruA [Desulfatiglans anilini]|uniref:tRNA pseudouridine(38-40) synthase TruA n=1 Tax=Desulfatiglans anilini TaxID=90728 RepID=UPI000552D7E7|nr:tRNA pseudouridine(38-40) synthase TruA [Desulfatiglans anilini]